MERRKPIKVNEAITHIMKYAVKGKTEDVSIEDSFGHFLGEDLIADHQVPPFDRSPYDGFAIRSKDTQSCSIDNPLLLEVVGEIGAGSVFDGTVGEKQAVRIMTGAQIPQGCDAVIMLELVKETTIDGQPFIQLRRKVKENENISFAGEDTKLGAILAPDRKSVV